MNHRAFAVILPPPGTLTLAWDPSPDPTVAGYRLYQGGQSLVYTNVLDIGNVTKATITGLVPGDTYYFAVTAYDSSGLESAFSGEISYTVPSSTQRSPGSLAVIIARDGSSPAIVSGTGPAGYVYNVLATQDFVSWSVIGTVTVDPSGVFQFADPLSGSVTSRFYRLEEAVSQPAIQGQIAPSVTDSL